MPVKKPDQTDVIHSYIWEEKPEANNPFAAEKCFCFGYDVYEDILPNASWIDYLWLLFKGEKPTAAQSKLLEKLAIAIANPGPREASVMASMNGGVGGSTWAACLTAALAVGAGQLGGAHEVYRAMQYWTENQCSLSAWRDMITNPPVEEYCDIWPAMEHIPGFDPHGVTCPKPIQQTLALLASLSPGKHLPWLLANQSVLEETAGYPLSMTGVAACAFTDLDMTTDQAELLFLFLRLPGAAVHAIEQNKMGFKKFPFFQDALILTNDPGPKD